MVIYPVVRWPVMFDLVRAVPSMAMKNVDTEMLVTAEGRECERLLSIYETTLAHRTAAEETPALPSINSSGTT